MSTKPEDLLAIIAGIEGHWSVDGGIVTAPSGVSVDLRNYLGSAAQPEPKLLHFTSVAEARQYAEDELLATLQDDLAQEDDDEMRNRIADLETVFALGRAV